MNRKQARGKESEQEVSKGGKKVNRKQAREKKVNRKQTRGKESEQEASKGERK